MLSAVLSKKTCAECRFCCTFRRKSLWETPLLSEEFMKMHTVSVNGEPVAYRNYSDKGLIYGQTDLTKFYKTDDPEEEVTCPFLDPEKGCSLPEDEKPFDCKIWPLRYMRMPERDCKVCLTPTCPAINKIDVSVMEDLVRNGLGDKIREYADTHPYIIKDYRDGFIVLER